MSRKNRDQNPAWPPQASWPCSLIVELTFADARQQDVLLIPVLHPLFIVLTSTAVTFWFRQLTTREELARDAAKIGTVVTSS